MSSPAPHDSRPISLNFKYVPRPGLVKITLINLVFNVLTLSIYRFWGKTNVRKHVWSCVHINGEPLEYTGTGMELFKGFLIVFGCIGLPFALLSTALQLGLGPDNPAVAGLNGLFFLFIYTMIGYAIYKARKYQLTRTLWRGIRGNLTGSAMTYTLTYFGSMLAKGASLGWATPVMNTVLQEQIIGNMRFGDAAFKFKGRAGPLYPTYAICWLILAVFYIAAILGLISAIAYLGKFDMKLTEDQITKLMIALVPGLIGFFFVFLLLYPALWSLYTAQQMQLFADYTRFDGAQFRLKATWTSLIWLAIVNSLLTVFTLGIAWPYVIQRNFRYVIDRLTLEGKIDVERIQQSMLSIPTRGEGLADSFDLSAW